MPSEYGYGDHLIRVTDGILEQFSMLIAGSFRIPVAWLAVDIEQRKHDLVRVQIGKAQDPKASIYSSVAFTSPAFTFEVPAGEEPQLRAFLDRVAADAGRAS